MPITFRCEHCRREVEAPDAAAGKRGKCPFCDGSNYIPSPVGDDDVIELAPLDEQEERRRQDESRKLLEQEYDLLAEIKDTPAVPLEHRDDLASADLHHFVVNYCLDMNASKLDRAERHVGKLRQFGQAGLQAVDDFVSGKAIEPALDAIPTRVLHGFLEQLRETLQG